MGALYFVFVGEISMTETQENLAMILLGSLMAGVGQIMNFLFGSSSGSKEKSEAMVTRPVVVEASGD